MCTFSPSQETQIVSRGSAAERRRAPRTPRERAEFERTVLPHQRALRGLAQRLCRTRADADDLLQDTLERAYLAFADLDPHTNPRSWLTTIMRNLFLDQCRRRARQRSDGDASLLNLPAPPAQELAPWRTIEAGQLLTALAGIDDVLKQAFLLRWTEQRTYRQIADELAIPVNTVGTRLLRARRSIRVLLEAQVGGLLPSEVELHDPLFELEQPPSAA